MPAEANDRDLVDRLRAGDEAAFTALVTRYHLTLVRVARCYVASHQQAEDVAQETWMGVVRGIDRFEGRSSFKTWLLQILVNRARSAGVREHRTVAVDLTGAGPVVDAARFDQRGMWSDPPVPFTDAVENSVDAAPLVAAVRTAIADLPEPQRTVVVLRDVEELPTAEVARLLGLSETNVRVILHRARAKVRQAAEDRLRPAVAARGPGGAKRRSLPRGPGPAASGQ